MGRAHGLLDALTQHKGHKGHKGLFFMKPNAASRRVIGAALKVHRALGAGILESAYQTCMCRQLAEDGLQFQHQVRLPLVYAGIVLPAAYRVDFIVENCLMIEIKCVEKLLPVHRAQLLAYLRLSGFQLGLLINFNVPHLRHGIKRVINGPEDQL
jgi:GxxExxY protein